MHKYPEDWRTIRLADTGRWLSGGTPNTSYPAYWGGDMPWISAASLKEFNIAHSDRRVTQLGAVSGTRIIPRDSVLFVVRGMSLKNEFRVGVTQREVTFGQDCKAIIAKLGINPRFLAYSLRANEDRILALVDEAGHGTGRLPTDQLAALTVGIPGLAEQQHITEILDSIDQSIHSAEQLIVKHQQRLDGVLLQFFRLVESAEVVALNNLGAGSSPVLRIGPFGSSLKGVDWVPAGVPVITIGSLGVGQISSGELLHITEAKASALSAYRVRAGDVVFSRVADVGRSVVICQAEEGWIMSSNLLRISVDCRVVRPVFLQLSLAYSPYVRGQLRATTNNSGRDVTSAGIIAALKVHVPPTFQQDLICSAWQAAMAAITVENTRLAKLRSLKRGMMEDLLTGRVRAKGGEDVAE